MKRIYFFLLIFSILSACRVANQTEVDSIACKVLVEEIAEVYFGDCRRGLAHGFGHAQGEDSYKGDFFRGRPHGEGTYTWANGDTYSGMWSHGHMHGKGSFFDAEVDSTFTGRWHNGERIENNGALAEVPYVVRYKRNITRYRFNRVLDGNRVFFKMGGTARDRQILQLSTHGSSGQYFTYSNMFGYEEVMFPFTGKISFLGPSRTGHTQYLVEMMFEINEPGYWEIIIYF